MEKMIKIVVFCFVIICFGACKKTSSEEQTYYETGELKQVSKTISVDSVYCVDYYKNGQKKREGFVGRDSLYFGLCKEYYKDGKLKWRGTVVDGVPDLFSKRGYILKKDIFVDVQGNPDTLKVGKSYGMRVYIEGVYPTAFLLRYSNRKEVDKNVKDPDLYPYIITPQKKGELEIIIQLMDDDGTFHKEGDEISVHIPVASCRTGYKTIEK